MTAPVVPCAHALSVEDVADALRSDTAQGLSADEAAARLTAFGPNEIPRATRPPYAQIAAHQLLDPLVALLLAASVVSLAVGEGLESAVIAAIVVLNAGFGFFQEVRAARAVLALTEAVEVRAVVVRDGEQRAVDVRDLVVGDLVRLREGDRVPADARVVSEMGLEVDESALTGESVPVAKRVEPADGAIALAERVSMVYAGTGVTRGSGLALVVAAGRSTEQGNIAVLTEQASPPPTPLEQRFARLATRLAGVGVLITIGLAAAMLLQGESARESFLLGVSVAVAAVPEGLAATVTIALALGAREMASRGAVVRTLSAIETVGEATVICADKTGTLTENRLRLVRVEPAVGTTRAGLLEAGYACAEAELDPVDRALVVAAREEGLTAPGTVVRSVPFEAARKRAAVLVREEERLRSVVKGAPEVVLGLGDDWPLERERLERVAGEWAAQGLRVLAIAERDVVDESASDLEAGARPLGIVGLADPLRPEAAESVRLARAEGLEVRMLTGDHPRTALAIGRELGLDDDEIVARCTPADKLALVEQLEGQGEIVIVTGDGVNDAPALRRAHVGVAMGRGGTEAAREASSIVLTDDNFATIVAAVREGKRIAGNIRSFLAFLLSANVGEVVLFAAAVLAGLGAPMTVVQVLTVNLLTDGPPAIALARDPAGRHAFRRGATRELFGRGIWPALLAVGIVVGAAALAAFLLVRELRPEAAQTAAYATVALAELIFVFSCRAELRPAWRLPRNRHLEAAVVGSLAFLLATIYVSALHDPFGTVSLTSGELGIVLSLALLPALASESLKAVVRRGRG
ncbi:MAG: cation-transporting P-type ATPase [Thermoleophilia bacterium]|nr:cation-transporting P-type ATPase [Thermoleophilia bacterium]MDH4339374.1 cation-transporting P-type ATPase [Thermoleophilia bacterium]MDH5280207.1 cation-transporting P-type ATPase [Thermoleophilia bacterium]